MKIVFETFLNFSRALLFTVLMACTTVAFSQNSLDTIHIGEVTITEKYMSDGMGLKLLVIDSATLQNLSSENISGLLSKHSAIQVKSYGSGGNASTSFRGAGANHTQFLWNGININSSMLGQADMNMLPNFFTDNISVYHGGASLSNNSGAFGGSINIANKPDWSKNFCVDFMQTAGSWSSYGSYLKTVFGSQKFHSSSRFFYTESENNYTYKRYDGGEDIRNNNAQYNASGFIQEFYFKPDTFNNISAILLLQKNSHNYPGIEKINSQSNNCGRALAEWTHHKGVVHIISRVAYMKNYLHYLNPDIDIDSKNTEKIYTGNLDAKISINKSINLSSGLCFNQSAIASNNYESAQSRQQFSLSAGIYGQIRNRFNYLVSLKQELYNEQFIPVIPSIGLEYSLLEKGNLYLKSNISRNFHMPSMNDLYWNPGGNSDLKPEEGYFFESGFLYNWSRSIMKQKASAELTCFYSEIMNNIIWIPNGFSSIWHAQNLKETRSAGIEIYATYEANIQKNKFVLDGNYTYTSAINKTAASANDVSVGKQLIYVPFHSGNAALQMSRANLFLNYTIAYTGVRYIYADNSWYMPPNLLSDISIGGVQRFARCSFTLQGTIANIMNTDYQAVAGFPMMRRNYRISLRISVF